MMPDSRPCSTLSLSRALKSQAHAAGDEEGDHRYDEEGDPHEPRDRVDRQVEVRGHDVVAAADGITVYQAIQATPKAVRVGAFRGRSKWCSRLSPVTHDSMNG